MLTTVEQARNQYALNRRLYGPTAEQAVAAKASLTVEKIVTYVERTLADSPPLTDQQCDRIIRALAPTASTQTPEVVGKVVAAPAPLGAESKPPFPTTSGVKTVEVVR